MDFESIWYEFSPYIYVVAGAFSIFKFGSTVSIVSGVLLIVAALTILRMRWVYRRTPVQKTEKRS